MFCLECDKEYSADLSICPDCRSWLARTPRKPAPSQAHLRSVLGQADSVKLLAHSDHRRVILEVNQSQCIAKLLDTLAFSEDPESFHRCCCSGEEKLEFFQRGDLLADIGLHHGTGIRCSLWDSDVYLLDGSKLLGWLAERGIPEPSRRFEEARLAEREMVDAAKNWISAAPHSLLDFAREYARQDIGNAVFVPTESPRIDSWSNQGPVIQPHHVELVEALKREYPQPVSQGRALFYWLGHGSIEISGYPSYESLTLELLLTLPTPVLIEAAQHAERTVEELKGSARFFMGHHFVSSRGAQLQRLPKSLKSDLLSTVRKWNRPELTREAELAFS